MARVFGSATLRHGGEYRLMPSKRLASHEAAHRDNIEAEKGRLSVKNAPFL
jgi:hypothetical protein